MTVTKKSGGWRDGLSSTLSNVRNKNRQVLKKFAIAAPFVGVMMEPSIRSDLGLRDGNL
ncbi:MAG: hypothetical protein ACFB9N_01475 [Geitlerinemataceae cyanobacterium]